MQHRKEQPMPRGWGVDESGMVSSSSLTTGCKPHDHSYLQETTDPGAVLDGGGLMPLGGSELTGRSLAVALFAPLHPYTSVPYPHTCSWLQRLWAGNDGGGDMWYAWRWTVCTPCQEVNGGSKCRSQTWKKGTVLSSSSSVCQCSRHSIPSTFPVNVL